MADVESHDDQAAPEINGGGHDPSLFLLLHALAQESRRHRITIGIGGLLISGRVVDENSWLELQLVRDPALGAMISKALQASRPASAPNARLTYLRERLRWGTGLTETQMEELEAAEQSEAQRSQFLHLAEVDIHGHGEVIHQPTWRARLDRVDGYSLAAESDRGHNA